MQRGDLLAQVLDPFRVRHHVVGHVEPRRTRRLGLERCFRLFPGHRVPCHEPFDLHGLRHVHDQDTVDMIASATLGQQRNHEYLVGPGLCRGNRLALHCGADGRMQDRLEPGACRCVAEDELAQPTPVEPAVGVEHFAAKGLCDSGQRRLAGLDNLAGDEISVDQRHAVGREQLGDGGLAARDAAGEGDAEGSASGLWCRRRHGGGQWRRPVNVR